MYNLIAIINYPEGEDHKAHPNLSQGELITTMLMYADRDNVTSCVFTVTKSSLANPYRRDYRRNR